MTSHEKELGDQEVVKIEPSIEEHPEILLAGCPQFGNPKEVCPGFAWNRLHEQREKIGLPKCEDTGYGVEVYPPYFPNENHEFYYFACFKADSITEKDPRFFTKYLPKCTIAIFNVPNNDYSKFPSVFHYAYQEWLPNSDYKMSFPFDFERYINCGIQKTEVCIPIENR